MSTGRPPILFPLFADLTGLPGVGAKTARLFQKIGVERVVDLLMTLPFRVEDRRVRDTLHGVEKDDQITARVEVLAHRPNPTATTPYTVVVTGGGITFNLVFFRPRKDWLQKMLPVGATRVICGEAAFYNSHLQIAHPDPVLTEEQARDMREWEPVYPATQGLTQRVIVRALHGALEQIPDLDEWIEPSVLRERAWPGWDTALRLAHNPDGPDGVTTANPARQRLAYDELLSHQLALALVRSRMKKGMGRVNRGDGSLVDRARAAFGFPPTGAQARALSEITADMADQTRMMRLLQGDVGAGKTWVAMMAMLTAVEAGGQAAMMAPTEILARQHAHGLAQMARAADVHLTLLTGRDTGAARRDKLERIADGRAQIVVGTHALFQKGVDFHDLRLAIVDEQHRFGVRQRMELADKAPAGADVLVMTATPIPRTLALAGYGDLDISVLDEKPPGRKPVDTALVSMDRYTQVVERLAAALNRGQRAYWVCPLVAENAELDLVAAEHRYSSLCRVLGADRVRLVHGQMPNEQKDTAISDFQAGRAQVLVATTVIEVGVDVPEATIMVVEQAEHFGLAQLHQLRGRVGRGADRSACLLMYAPPLTETARARLSIMRETEDGFRIAEEDLAIRGAGDVMGTAQSGLPRFRIADLGRDTALMELARDEARLVISTDPGLTTPRGKALRTLLYLMDRDQSVRLLKAG